MRESRERRREGELQWKGMTNGVNHEVMNGERGEERRGALPGWLSTNHHHSLDGGGGTYLQTCAGAGKPSPGKQQLSEALGLIPGARRLRGPARVASQEGPGARGWHGGGTPCSRTHRRGGETETEVWWTSGDLHPSSDSERGSTASSSAWSASVESSSNSSGPTRPGATESGSETEKQDWETVEEETADPELERRSRSETEQERESGSEAEAEAGSKPSKRVAGGNRGSTEGGNSSAKLHQESAKSVAAPPSSPPPRSAQESTEEEVEEAEEVGNVLWLPSASQASSSEQPARRGLSPITEDPEDQEEGKGEEEEAGELGDEPAD